MGLFFLVGLTTIIGAWCGGLIGALVGFFFGPLILVGFGKILYFWFHVLKEL